MVTKVGDRSILVTNFKVEIMRAVDSSTTHSIDSQFELLIGRIAWSPRSLFTRDKLDH